MKHVLWRNIPEKERMLVAAILLTELLTEQDIRGYGKKELSDSNEKSQAYREMLYCADVYKHLLRYAGLPPIPTAILASDMMLIPPGQEAKYHSGLLLYRYLHTLKAVKDPIVAACITKVEGARFRKGGIGNIGTGVWPDAVYETQTLENFLRNPRPFENIRGIL